MRRVTLPIVCLGMLLSKVALAAGFAPAGGGLDAIAATPEAGGLRVRHCKTADCTDHDAGNAGRLVPIPIAAARQDLAAATFEAVPIGEGRSVLHVRIPDVQRKDLAFEAILAGQREEVIFAGLTGYTRGEDGERSGDAVLVYDRDERSKFVLVGELREDTRICGQAMTPLGARGLDARTMQLRGATFQRIDKAARDAAIAIEAKPTAVPQPLAQILVATGGSAPNGMALTDGAPATAWNELRPGDGHGEFVTMRAPAEVPLHALALTTAAARPNGASPRTLFVATDAKLFHVTLPDGKPGQTLEVPFPEPVRTSCVAIVLDEAHARGAAPEVALAEVAAVTSFDAAHASLADVAKELGARPDALAVLQRAGERGLAAVAERWSTMNPQARALGVDVASSAGSCDGPAMELLTRALGDTDAEVKRRAVGRVERCGKAAAPSLAAAVRSGEEARVGPSAALLATIAPSLAVDPIAEALGQGSVSRRKALRLALARSLGAASRGRLVALLEDRSAAPEVQLDRVRATTARLAELRPTSDEAIADLLARTPDMATRWLLAAPIAQLARAGAPEDIARLEALVKRDPDGAVRARAVELAAPIPALSPAITAATADPEPRVREAALHAIAGTKRGDAGAATRALGDPWTFVRVAAVDALGALGNNEPVVEKALEDASPLVRVAAVGALARSPRSAKKIYARLDDAREDGDVRALAATTLGAMCWRDATDRLTKLALHAADPESERQERVARASLQALAMLHPPDLAKRIAPLRAKDVRLPVRTAAERAVAEPGTCK